MKRQPLAPHPFLRSASSKSRYLAWPRWRGVLGGSLTAGKKLSTLHVVSVHPPNKARRDPRQKRFSQRTQRGVVKLSRNACDFPVFVVLVVVICGFPSAQSVVLLARRLENFFQGGSRDMENSGGGRRLVEISGSCWVASCLDGGITVIHDCTPRTRSPRLRRTTTTERKKRKLENLEDEADEYYRYSLNNNKNRPNGL